MITDAILKFVPFSPDELNDIRSHFEKEYVQKNQLLLQEGQVCKKLYFVEKGIGRSYYLKKEGKEVTQWFFGDGNFMSSVDSFFQESPSFYYVQIFYFLIQVKRKPNYSLYICIVIINQNHLQCK